MPFIPIVHSHCNLLAYLKNCFVIRSPHTPFKGGWLLIQQNEPFRLFCKKHINTRGEIDEKTNVLGKNCFRNRCT